MDNGPLQKLFDLVRTLRGENGCPWDRVQVPENIISDLIEEVYELQWAHAHESKAKLIDEMGDVVFVLTFAVALLQEKDPEFTLDRLATHAYEKIKRRHPHVFGDAVAATREEGLAHWNRMKAEEARADGDDGGRFSGIPGNLPPMRMAEKIQRRAADVGFDWSDTSGIFDKIREEVSETEAVVATGPGPRIEEELGDLLFSVMNLCRFLHVDAEKALAAANAKFVARYEAMEKLVANDGRRLQDMTLADMDGYWERTKKA